MCLTESVYVHILCLFFSLSLSHRARVRSLAAVKRLMRTIFTGYSNEFSLHTNGSARFSCKAFSPIFTLVFVYMLTFVCSVWRWHCCHWCYCCCGCCCCYFSVSLVSQTTNVSLRLFENSTFAVNKDRLCFGWASKFAIISTCVVSVCVINGTSRSHVPLTICPSSHFAPLPYPLCECVCVYMCGRIV